MTDLDSEIDTSPLIAEAESWSAKIRAANRRPENTRRREQQREAARTYRAAKATDTQLIP
jgi:hypothetical protein